MLQGSLGGTAAPAGNQSQSPEVRLEAELKHQLKRFSQIVSSYSFSILDPRFKKISFSSAERTIERISGEVCNVILNDTDGSTSSKHHKTEESVHESDFWGTFDKKVAEASMHRTNLVESAVEIRRYIQEKNLPRQEDPLGWWKQQASGYPHLCQLFKKYLCIPATSVPSERALYKAGELVSKKRSNLKPVKH